jgi:hypothetical protein
MKFEDLTNEQLEKVKACNTLEEEMAFFKENNIELPDNLLDEVAGGQSLLPTLLGADQAPSKICPKENGRNEGKHRWSSTLKTRMIHSKEFPYHWSETEYKCIYCGVTYWG